MEKKFVSRQLGSSQGDTGPEPGLGEESDAKDCWRAQPRRGDGPACVPSLAPQLLDSITYSTLDAAASAVSENNCSVLFSWIHSWVLPHTRVK